MQIEHTLTIGGEQTNFLSQVILSPSLLVVVIDTPTAVWERDCNIHVNNFKYMYVFRASNVNR